MVSLGLIGSHWVSWPPCSQRQERDSEAEAANVTQEAVVVWYSNEIEHWPVEWLDRASRVWQKQKRWDKRFVQLMFGPSKRCQAQSSNSNILHLTPTDSHILVWFGTIPRIPAKRVCWEPGEMHGLLGLLMRKLEGIDFGTVGKSKHWIHPTTMVVQSIPGLCCDIA